MKSMSRMENEGRFIEIDTNFMENYESQSMSTLITQQDLGFEDFGGLKDFFKSLYVVNILVIVNLNVAVILKNFTKLRQIKFTQ